MSGDYGLTKVVCTPVFFGGPNPIGPYSLILALRRIWDILKSVIE